MEPWRASNGGIAFEDAFVVNPREPVERAVFTHASLGPLVAPENGELISTSRDAIKLLRVGDTILASGAFDAIPECETLILDATYALPVFRWPSIDEIADSLRVWLQLNADAERAALLLIEPRDEANELLARVPVEPVITDSRFVRGVPIASLEKRELAGRLILHPLDQLEALPKLPPHETAIASGRMRVRGNRRRLAADRGFVISSRADWPMFERAIAKRPRKLIAFGAHADTLVRIARENGIDAHTLEGAR